jgi:hypothetical protein
VRGDDPDDGVADFAVSLEGTPVPQWNLFTRIRLIWDAQIAAQHINAGLPILRPVIGQDRHGVHPGQLDSRRLVTAQLAGRRGEPFVQRPGALLRERPVQLLTLLCERSAQLLALLRDPYVQLLALLCESAVQLGTLLFESLFALLTLLFERLFVVLARRAAAKTLRNHRPGQGTRLAPAAMYAARTAESISGNLLQLAVRGAAARPGSWYRNVRDAPSRVGYPLADVPSI